MFTLSNNIKNKQAIGYINHINDLPYIYNLQLTNDPLFIESVYKAIIFICKKPITINIINDKVFFDYDINN